MHQEATLDSLAGSAILDLCATRHAAVALAPIGACEGTTVERKRKIMTPQGEMDATEVGYRSSGEYWNEYLADDGSVIRMKLVVTAITRVDGMYDALGNPVYQVASSNIMSVSAPEELRKQP